MNRRIAEKTFKLVDYLKLHDPGLKRSPPNVYLTCPVCERPEKLWGKFAVCRGSKGISEGAGCNDYPVAVSTSGTARSDVGPASALRHLQASSMRSAVELHGLALMQCEQWWRGHSPHQQCEPLPSPWRVRHRQVLLMRPSARHQDRSAGADFRVGPESPSPCGKVSLLQLWSEAGGGELRVRPEAAGAREESRVRVAIGPTTPMSHICGAAALS